MTTNPSVPCVYLVDDDDDLRMALVYVLETAGYKVQAFASPARFQTEALKLSQGVLLLDMRMPELSGLELHAWLRLNGFELPVIFISGESLPSEIVEALKQDAQDFLLKPFAMAELLAAVNKALALDAARVLQQAHALRARKLWQGLTRREREVCHLMIKGFANREIAKLHGSLPATVKLHRSRVLDKMAVASLSALIALLDNMDLQRWLAEDEPS